MGAAVTDAKFATNMRRLCMVLAVCTLALVVISIQLGDVLMAITNAFTTASLTTNSLVWERKERT